MTRCCVFVVLLGMVTVFGVASQETAWSDRPLALQFSPSLDVPVGSEKDLFRLGGGLTVTGEYGVVRDPLVVALAGIDYSAIP